MTNTVIAAMSPSEIQGMVDHAAQQSDRYLFVVAFIALVVLLVLYGAYQTRWVRSLVEEMRTDRKSTNDVIQANTVALTRMADKLQ